MSVRPALHSVRTPEQIEAQLRARYAEMEAEAQSPARQFPCAKCRWAEGPAFCAHPLVKGFGDSHFSGRDQERLPVLCGPERALWETQTGTQRVKGWLNNHPALAGAAIGVGIPAGSFGIVALLVSVLR